MQCSSSHLPCWVAGGQTAHSCDSISCQISSVWRDSNPSSPPRAKQQSVIPVVVWSTAAGLFNTYGKYVFPKLQILLTAGSCPATGSVLLDCVDRCGCCQAGGVGTSSLQEGVGNRLGAAAVVCPHCKSIKHGNTEFPLPGFVSSSWF